MVAKKERKLIAKLIAARSITMLATGRYGQNSGRNTVLPKDKRRVEKEGFGGSARDADKNN